jgi:hypothetical protein
MKSVIIRGRRFKLKDCQAPDAECSDPNSSHRYIAIPVKGDTLGDLTVIIHEMIHAAFWDVDEDIVNQTGYDFARALWKMGWRQKD